MATAAIPQPDPADALDAATDGTNGLHHVIGRWPGDQAQEKLLALERHLDEEDAGRAPWQ